MQGKGRPRLRGRGDAEKRGTCHAVERRDLRKQRDKEELSPLQRERKEESTLENGGDGKWKRQGETGRLQEGKERGRAGRKEELLEESPGEPRGEPEESREDGWRGSSRDQERLSLCHCP